jgi:hypothetical protein
MRALPPLDAIKTFITGQFYPGDEDDALMEAIRKDPRVTLPDEELMEIIWDGMEAAEEAEDRPNDVERIAEECLKRLTSTP